MARPLGMVTNPCEVGNGSLVCRETTKPERWLPDRSQMKDFSNASFSA